MLQPLSHAGGVEHLRGADLEHAVEIAPRVWWVSHYIPADPFQCHVYLLEQGDQSVLVDPGPLLTFDITRREIEEVTPFGNVRYFVCQHPDPDITAALPVIDRLFANPRLPSMCG